MTDLTRKQEVSTSKCLQLHSQPYLTIYFSEALLDEARAGSDSIRGRFSDSNTELIRGTRFDKNDLPDTLAWDKTKTEKVAVMENKPAKM